jgi:hypothetical protein
VSTDPTVSITKTIWSQADFPSMGWHDNAVHALAIEPALPHPGRLLIDLDYIIEWVQPISPAKTFNFWICPATLVFDQAWDLSCDIDLSRRSFELALDGIERSAPDIHGGYEWTLAGHDFALRLHSTSFTQYLRHPPIHSLHQRLPLDQRGGLSFDESVYTM